jgi:hypothetical protein
MPKYNKFLTAAEYDKLSVDERFEYLMDMAEILKTTRDYTRRPGSPLAPPPKKPKTD